MSEETEKTCGNLDMAIKGLESVADNMVREIQRLRAENERLLAGLESQIEETAIAAGLPPNDEPKQKHGQTKTRKNHHPPGASRGGSGQHDLAARGMEPAR